MQKKRLPLWALAWVALVLTGLVVFLANQQAVDRLLAVTGLEKVLYPQGKAATPLIVETPGPGQTVLVDPATSPRPTPAVAPEAPAAPAAETEAPVEPPLPATPNTYRLYFLKLSPEGRMEPSGFTRELPAVTTPLAATLKALLLGPTLQDKALGAITLVPEGTKLLSIRIQDRIALVSLSEEFEHNASGVEGLVGQLRQIIWTATQFGSVDGVQILINGQYRDSLGDGGPSIAAPLDRKAFP